MRLGISAMIVVALGSVMAACEGGRSEAARYPLIPAPAELIPRDDAFVLDADTRVMLVEPDSALQSTADLLFEPLRLASGLPLAWGSTYSADDSNVIVLSRQVAPLAETNRESYELSVTQNRISVSSTTRAGLFRGLMTLRQLLPAEVERAVRASAPWGRGMDPAPATGLEWSVPGVDIRDEPRFVYRGMQLDVGRHFFPVEFIKKYIDLVALFRMNTFHWHLTEDQGWRVQIESYPRLTEVGSCRAETIVEKNFDPFVGDGVRYCGFYTRDEIRDVVAYAAARHITVIPEIEMPGHSLAALAAYPELACTAGPFEVGTRWGVHEDIYCPGEQTFRFLEAVLTEVLELFPSPYIHIGGDEAPKARWEESAVAQEVIRREGLADVDELQSWFIRRIEAFLNARGRSIIGWDEILEGGLAPNATVMSWRGTQGGVEAARMGHDVIMTPTSHVYFDYYQADPEVSQEPLAICCLTTLDEVYAYDPVPAELSADQAVRVLGAQANVWTEYIRTPAEVEYMALPRMLALAEVVWSPPGARDFASFIDRLHVQLGRLDELGVGYRPPVEYR